MDRKAWVAVGVAGWLVGGAMSPVGAGVGRTEPPKGASSLGGRQQTVQTGYSRWEQAMKKFLEASDPRNLTSADRSAWEQMDRIFQRARQLEPSADLSGAVSALRGKNFSQALDHQGDVIEKFESLLFFRSPQGPPPPPPPPGPRKDPEIDVSVVQVDGLPEDPDEKSWLKLKGGEEEPTECPPCPPKEGNDGEKKPCDQPGPGSTATPGTGKTPASGDRSGGGPGISGDPLAGPGEWAKLPPKQLERLIETRLDTLPTENGWREMVKDYFLKMGHRSSRRTGQGRP